MKLLYAEPSQARMRELRSNGASCDVDLDKKRECKRSEDKTVFRA
jgi:hypothetical protein